MIAANGAGLRTKFYNEMYGDGQQVRPHYAAFADWLRDRPAEWLAQKRGEADALFHRLGITFAVYGEEQGTERLIPFDIVPRVLTAAEWSHAGARARAARARAERLHRRRLRRPAHPRPKASSRPTRS